MIDHKAAATELLKKLLPSHYEQLEIQILPQPLEYFDITGETGHIIIKACNILNVGSALKHYLRYCCKCSFSWNGDHIKLPQKLPKPIANIHKECKHKYRYYLNYCTFGYSMAWWDWERWERELDWMAINGINLLLMTVGQEAVWLNTFLKFNYSEDEILKWLSVPSHLPWQWMANLHSFGGPLPKSWILSHIELGRKIIERMRVLGIKPVLQGYYGMIPENYDKKFPEAKIFDQGKWVLTFNRPPMLDLADPMFSKVAEVFYLEQEKLFGKCDHFAADPFHEGGEVKGIDIKKGAQSIQEGMLKYNQNAIWVLQAWWGNPKDEILSVIKKSNTLVLDLYCDYPETAWEKRNSFDHTPWVFNIVHNFGCNPGLFGNFQLIADHLSKALQTLETNSMVGLGTMMEGIEQNPIIYEFIYDMAWEKDVPQLQKWVMEYIEARYGKLTDNIKKAWSKLLSTVYGLEMKTSKLRRCSTIGLKCRPPYKNLYYSITDIAQIWKLFLDSASDYNPVEDTMSYDLLMVTKQVLTILARWMYNEIMHCFEQKDDVNFLLVSHKFRELIIDIDTLMNTRKEFLIGKWIADAKKWGTTSGEKKMYEFGAKVQVTLWDNIPDSPLNDYATKEWAGLFKDYYYMRWDMYFNFLHKALQEKSALDMAETKIKIGEQEKKWVSAEIDYPSEASGDTWMISLNLYAKYMKEIEHYCGKYKNTEMKDFIGKWKNEFFEKEFKENGEFNYICKDNPLKNQTGKWVIKEGNAYLYLASSTEPFEIVTVNQENQMISHIQFDKPALKI